MDTIKATTPSDLSNFGPGIHQIQWQGREVWLIEQAWGQLVVAKLGAQILYYQPVGEHAVFWLNPEPSHCDNESIRGGVPLCWPWFGLNSSDSSKANHGTARTALWTMCEQHLQANHSTTLTFMPVEQLCDALAVTFEISVSDNYLSMRILTRNISDQEQNLTQAIHSYFFVADSQKIIVQGLKGCEYLDKLQSEKLKYQRSQLSQISAIDSIYKHTADAVIVDEILSREIVISKAGSGSTVVWNPGQAAKNYGIFSGQMNFICIEAANTDHESLCLAPGQQVVLQQTVELRCITR